MLLDDFKNSQHKTLPGFEEIMKSLEEDENEDEEYGSIMFDNL